jgi:hypothetical protein
MMKLFDKNFFFLIFIIVIVVGSFAKVERMSCKDFFNVSIKGNPIDFTNELNTLTKDNIKSAIEKTNKTIGRRSDLINTSIADNLISELNGIGLYRLGNNDINCFIGVDNGGDKLLIVDSRNKDSEDFKICGPVVQRTKNFPWFKISWDCLVLWSYSCSKIATYGEYGNRSGQFSTPTAIVSDGDGQTGAPVNLWVADSYNGRIVHLRYSIDGNMSWVNSIGNFSQPIDLAYKRDSETPVIYVAEKNGCVIRIPVTNAETNHFQQLDGYIIEAGYGTDPLNFNRAFMKPTGVCINQTSDLNDYESSTTYLYVADAGRKKIYRYMETGKNLQYINSVDLKPIDVERGHLGIRCDKFGTVYVFDKTRGKVIVYSKDLEELYEFGSFGEHSSTDITFNGPTSGFITGNNLFVVDWWSSKSGIQRFNIEDIDIIHASVDYSTKTAKVLADNAFDRCTYSIDGATAQEVTGLQFAGTFQLDLEDVLNSITSGEHSLTISLRSAYNSAKTCTKTIKFIVDPNADKKPRNIRISTVGRRIDIKWDEPLVTAGLSAYIVYIDDNVLRCNTDTRSVSWFASREQAGETVNIKLGARYNRDVTFSSLTNFSTIENGIEQIGSGDATAIVNEQLRLEDLVPLPVGATWRVGVTLPDNISNLTAQPLLTFGPINCSLEDDGSNKVLHFLGFGINGRRDVQANDRVEFVIVKNSSSWYELGSNIIRNNNHNYVGYGSVGQNSLPFSIQYHSNTPGFILQNLTIGQENTMSSSFSVTLRSVGNVIVDGSSLTLDNAVATVFNGDNIQLSDAQYTLSVPLNVIPYGDEHTTDVNYSICLNPAAAGFNSKISYTGPENIIDASHQRIQVNISLRDMIIKSDKPLIFLNGDNNLLYCNAAISMQKCVIDAPSIKIIDDTNLKPIPASGNVVLNFISNTFTMAGSSSFINLLNFTGITLNMSDNLIYQKDFGSCFCFSNVSGLCASPYNVTMSDNTFLLANVCTGCDISNTICTPLQNEIITTLVSGFDYLGSDYGMANIHNPGVTVNSTTGNIENIRGCIKTINGASIGTISNPDLLFGPALFTRANPGATIDECRYLPLPEKTKFNISMDSRGKIYTSENSNSVSPHLYEMKDYDSYKSQDMLPGQILYAYGESSFGLPTKKYALAFPGRIIFDEHPIANFYGAPSSAVDCFKGITSTDAANGTISWKVESLPIGGDPLNGFEKQRTESFYEPLPDVTDCESFSFYYKKQYADQQFSLSFEDEHGISHVIQNTPLTTGTRGWYFTSDAPTLDWQYATITLKNETNLPTGELPLSGKLMRFSIHHQSITASSAVPVWMLFDDIKFQSSNMVIFDEQDPADFVGKGGNDGFGGLTSTVSFAGTKSYKVTIGTGNSRTSDEWTGLSSSLDLPVSLNKRKLTFAYKKTDPASFATIKFYMQNLETNATTVFEISEQDAAENISNTGWPIPHHEDTLWHQVFIDLFSCRGPGNTDRAAGSPMPFGKCTKVELVLTGLAGAECLFDNIKFIQDFYRQEISTNEQYSVSPDYSEEGYENGWKLNALGNVSKNTIISYGAQNHIMVEENYQKDAESEANNNLLNKFEVEKQLALPESNFPNTYIYWQEKGTPIGYIELAVKCSDNNEYPLAFSATGYSLPNSKGVFNFKVRSDVSETKHSYNILETFNKCYPELVNGSPPVSPINVRKLKVLYNANTVSGWYSKNDYSQINFIVKDPTPLAVTLAQPINSGEYGVSLPVELTTNKELRSARILIKNGTSIVHQTECPIMGRGQSSFTGSIDLQQLNTNQLEADGRAKITVEVTDIFGETVSTDRLVKIDWTIPVLSLREPDEGSAFNNIVTIDGYANIPLKSVTYQIIGNNGNAIKENSIDLSVDTTDFRETIAIDDADRFQKVTLLLYGTSSKGINSPLVKRTIILNPIGSQVVIGPVTNPGIIWDTTRTGFTLCGASGDIGGTQDNLLLYSANLYGNFEATIGVSGVSGLLSSAKAGLMVRSDLTAGTINDYLYVTNTGTFLQYRPTANGPTTRTCISTVVIDKIWLKLKRIGTKLIYYTSADGLIYTESFSREIGTLTVVVGPAYTSGSTATRGCADFTDLSIEKLPDVTDKIVLGVTTETRVLPLIIQNGVLSTTEDKSTINSGEVISIGGVTYATGIGGMPQSDGSSSFQLYDLTTEASRLQIEKFVKLTGLGGIQDGATAVRMQIKAANTVSMPNLEEWINPTGQVYVAWDKPMSLNAKIIDIDLTGVKWLCLFISSTTMSPSCHGAWGELEMEYIGSEHKAPVIITDPKPITRLVGERAVFSVKATGSLPLSYQWQKNNMNIFGANASAYMTVPVKMNDDGAVYRCVVSNTFGKEYSMDAELSVVDEPVNNIPGFAIVSSEYLDIRDQASITGSSIISNADIGIGCDANVNANVLAVGNIAVGDRTVVKGDVFAAGSVTLGAGTKVEGGSVAGGQSISTVAIESHSITYGSTDVTINNGATRELEPGDYRDLHAYSYSTLHLGAGTYNFRKSIFESNVTVIFDLNGNEKTIINIDDETRFGDWCNTSINGTAGMFAVTWYSNYLLDVPIHPDSRIIGQLIIPAGNLHVYSRSVINGSCQAKRVTLEPNAGINFSNTSPSTNQKPVISIAAEAASNPVLGTSTVMNVLGVDDGGEENLIYHWTAPTIPSGAWVNISDNNSNAAKNITATFNKPGVYTIRATVEDAYLLRDTSLLNVVVDQTLTSIEVSPINVSVAPTMAQQFTANAKDQFGIGMTVQPDLSWSVNGGGAIDVNGLFTAGTTTGNFVVTVSKNDISAAANVSITSNAFTPDQNLMYTIVNVNSGKVLQPKNGTANQGDTIVQMPYTGYKYQLWKFVALGNGYYNIINKNSGYYMDISGARMTAGAANINWTSNSGLNQKWLFGDAGTGVYNIQNQNSGIYLDISGASTADGAICIQWPLNSNANQKWRFEQFPYPTKWYKLTNVNSGKVLQPKNGASNQGDTIVQMPYTSANYQMWKFVSEGNGYYTIVNKNSGYYMDIYGAGTTAGTCNVNTTSNGGSSQKWGLVNTGIDSYNIQNQNSGLYLDITGASTANGAMNIQWNQNGGNNQKWRIEEAQ